MSKTESLLEKLVKTRLRRVAVFTVLWICVWFFGAYFVFYIIDYIAGLYWHTAGFGYFIALIPFILFDSFSKRIKKYKNLYFLILLVIFLMLYPLWGIAFLHISAYV